MCGIIGVFDADTGCQNKYNSQDYAMLGLFAEQHRGQESCGMAVSDGGVFKLKKEMGLVKQVFTPEVLSQLKGRIAVGHVRYPTRGSATHYNSQPHVVETLAGPSFALASNGDIVNYSQIRSELEDQGVYFASDNDGELLIKYIVYQVDKKGKSIVEAIKLLMENIKGAYSTVLATRDALYMFRDPQAIRPMVWGKTDDNVYIAASESCALNILGIYDFDEVNAGEIIIVTNNGTEKILGVDDRNKINLCHCIFEHIYFSRPDSYNFKENIYMVRECIGSLLADLDDFDADMVIPVPDSANFMAIGYTRKKQIPFEMGLIRNHYVGRTFIKPEQTIRDEGVQHKYNALPNFFEGKKIILVDDSLVRGTTIKKIIDLILRAGAKEVHLRIGSPPVKYSCFYGIDTPTKEELIANRKSLEGIREYIGADTLKYLPVNLLKNIVSKPDNYCSACFTGDYPI